MKKDHEKENQIIGQLCAPITDWRQNQPFERALLWLKERGYRMMCDSVIAVRDTIETRNRRTGELFPGVIDRMEEAFEEPWRMEREYHRTFIVAVGMSFMSDPLRPGAEEDWGESCAGGRMRVVNLILTKEYLYAFRAGRCLDRLERWFHLSDHVLGMGSLKELCMNGCVEVHAALPAFFHILKERDLLFDNLVRWKCLGGCGHGGYLDEKGGRELLGELKREGYEKVESLSGREPGIAGRTEYESILRLWDYYVSESGLFVVFLCRFGKGKGAWAFCFRDVYEEDEPE